MIKLLVFLIMALLALAVITVKSDLLTKKQIISPVGSNLSWTDQLVRNLQLNLLTIDKIEVVNSRQIKVFLADGPLVIFNSQRDQQRQLDSLQFILARTKIDGKRPAKIDLRFDKPVLVYD